MCPSCHSHAAMRSSEFFTWLYFANEQDLPDSFGLVSNRSPPTEVLVSLLCQPLWVCVPFSFLLLQKLGSRTEPATPFSGSAKPAVSVSASAPLAGDWSGSQTRNFWEGRRGTGRTPPELRLEASRQAARELNEPGMKDGSRFCRMGSPRYPLVQRTSVRPEFG